MTNIIHISQEQFGQTDVLELASMLADAEYTGDDGDRGDYWGASGTSQMDSSLTGRQAHRLLLKNPNSNSRNSPSSSLLDGPAASTASAAPRPSASGSQDSLVSHTDGMDSSESVSGEPPARSTAQSTALRLPKIVRMHASRACRSSIMIGTALKQHEMLKVVRNLEGVDQPWNCPHGRPTMRHLFDLESFLKEELHAESQYSQ